jgi:heme oxygenase (biliverdin-IX-beta and delta-forming)
MMTEINLLSRERQSKSAPAGLHLAANQNVALRCLLRDATTAEHRRVDGAMSCLDLSDRFDYGIFLRIHLNAMLTLAGSWGGHDHLDFYQLLQCLVDDLRSLDQPIDSFTLSAPSAARNSLRQWGTAYVIRGSRLGAAVLRQRVPAAFPAAFVSHSLNITWPEFLNQLGRETRSIDRRSRAQIVLGARQAFAAFTVAADDFGPGNE